MSTSNQPSGVEFQLIADQVRDYALFMLTPEGNVASWDKGAQRIKGYSADEIIGRHFSEFFTPEDRQAGKPERILRTAAEQGRYEDVGIRVRKGGERFQADAVITALRNADGSLRGFLKITRDVGEQASLADALRASEERFRLLVEQVQDYAIFLLDAAGNIMSWNEGARRINGYEEDEILGKNFSLFYPPEDVASGKPRNELEAAAKVGRIEDLGWRVRKDGSRFFSDTVITALRNRDGSLRGFAKVTRDITAQREAAQTVEQQARLLDLAPIAIIVREKDDRVRFWNRGAEELFGWTAEEATGQNALELLHAQFQVPREEVEERLRRTGRWEGELQYQSKSGATVLTFSRWSAANEGNDRILQVDTDVTARKSLEEQLRQSQKLQAIGMLAGGVAHEFNNLLTVVLGSAQLCLSRFGDLLIEDLQPVVDAAERGAALTQKLLAFARQQIVRPQPLDLAAVVENLAPMLRAMVGEAILLRLQLGEAVPSIFADRVQVEHIILNLVANARDAMPEGGELTITVRTVRPADTAEGAQPRVELIVADTGTGIPDDVLPRIFEPFFTTKPVGQGTGLGLAMAYGSVEQIGGTIRVETKAGRGTTFVLDFAAHGEAQKTDGPASKAQAAVAAGSGTVLVVEDETSVRSLIRRVLEQSGFQVLLASDGKEALAIARDFPGVINLLMTDIVMPGMRGGELARELMLVRPDIRIVFISGYPAEQPAPQGTGSLFLAKPFSPAVLMNAVRRVLAPT
jgi:PAS domain S-box-containing protein